MDSTPDIELLEGGGGGEGPWKRWDTHAIFVACGSLAQAAFAMSAGTMVANIRACRRFGVERASASAAMHMGLFWPTATRGALHVRETLLIIADCMLARLLPAVKQY